MKDPHIHHLSTDGTHTQLLKSKSTEETGNSVEKPIFLLHAPSFPPSIIPSFLTNLFSTPQSLAFTTVLIRTPYDKSAANNRLAGTYWSQNGFCAFIQDCRGRFASAGTFYKYTAEANDGFDTVQWVASQPWSNSKVVGDGKSYLTHTQMTLSLTRPPAWAGSFAYMGGFWNAFTSGVRQGGVYETRQLVWAFKKAPRPTPAIKKYFEQLDFPTWLHNAYPWKARENFLAHAPSFQRFVRDQSSMATFSSFWEQIGFNTQKYAHDFSLAPALFLAGWYDIYARSTVEFFTGLSDPKVIENARLKYSSTDLSSQNMASPIRLLVMGPWTHTGGTQSRVAGNVDFGSEAVITNLWKEYQSTWRHVILQSLNSQAIQVETQGKLQFNSSSTSAITSELKSNIQVTFPTHTHYDFVRTWFDFIVPRNQEKGNGAHLSPLLSQHLKQIPPVR